MKDYNRYHLYARKELDSELMKTAPKAYELKPIQDVWRYQIKIPSVYPWIYDSKENKWVE